MACYFYEDEVFRVTKKGQVEFGVVLRNVESTDTDSESDLEEPQRLRPGQVLVSWHPSSREQVVAEKKVGLTDRCLMLGDIVRRLVPGQDTQCGYCRNVSMSSVVQVCGTSRVIYEVSSQRLTPLEEFVADVAVCLDSWVGMISSVNSEVTVEFSDRSLCVLSGTQVIELDEVDGWRKPDSEAWYYPGQKLQGTMRRFQSARWLRCNRETEAMKQRKNKSVKVTVTDYHVVSLHVHWQCSAGCGTASDSKAPPVFISGDQLSRLRMLNVLEPCTLQLGDINTCRLRAEDVVMSLDQWKWLEKDTMKQLLASKKHQPTAAASAPAAASSIADAASGSATGLQVPSEDAGSVSSYNSATADSAVQQAVRRPPRLKTVNMKKRKLKRSRRSRHHDVLEVRPEPNIGDKLVVETLKTQSTVTVVWQDGAVEEDIPSVDLYPMHHLDEHEFFPGDFVREQKTGVNAGVCDYGVVQRVDHRDRTAVVDWYRDQPSARPALLRRDEVSVYDISDHADYRYRPGTVVLNTDVRTEPPCSDQPLSTDVSTEPPCSDQPLSTDVSTEPPCSDQPPSTDIRTEPSCTSAGVEASHHVQLHTQQPDCDSPPLLTSEQSAVAPAAQHAALVVAAEAPASAEDAEAATVDTTKAFAGQVLDVLTTGMVKVWWTDETISECYPQSLIRVGEYDSDEGELWDNNADSTDSTEWETESEESIHIGGGTVAAPETPADVEEAVSCEMRLSPHCAVKRKLEEADQISLGKRLLLNITQTHSALVRTQDILDQRAALQSPAVLKQLVSIYQDCRCLDKLLDTNFFDESHFSGFISELQETSRVVAGGHDAHAESGADGGASGGAQGNQPKHPRLNGYCEGVVGFEKASVFCGQIRNQLYSAYEQVKSRCPWADDGGLGDLLKKSAGVVCHSPSPSSQQPSHHMTSHASPISPSEGAISCGSHDSSGFAVLSSEPDGHVYQNTTFKPADPSGFLRAVKREMKMLASSLPDGIVVRGYEQRMDLYSVMICGPPRTPYADGLFFFDVQLDSEYPRTPPTLHYHSYCRDRINPNLYEDGKVCVSLLGTWGGRGSEVWAPSSSTLLQVLVSIQGLILVSEPYYNEAGYDKQRGTQQAGENSRLYNEMVLVKLVQSLTTIAERSPVVFAEEVSQHLRSHSSRLIQRLRGWLRLLESSTSEPDSIRPDFPLLPVSRGFRITLNKSITHLVQTLEKCGVSVDLDGADMKISSSPIS